MIAALSPRVAVIMGSDSDLRVMQAASDALTELGVEHEMTVVSAHRTPQRMVDYAQAAAGRGLSVIIAGAGGAAHLPGMVASLTDLPVVGVPITATALQGMDALLSIVQMPAGVPVATVGVDNGRNAGLLAAKIVATADPQLRERLTAFRAELEQQSLAKAAKVEGR
ncbi:MAG: 5-(carboxyamino)imidazole ribonucleotide mutase [Acidobacteriota bacterium]